MSKDNCFNKSAIELGSSKTKMTGVKEDLSFKSGFHRTYIGMIERGERNPSLKNISVFANTFNISLSELLKLEINEMG